MTKIRYRTGADEPLSPPTNLSAHILGWNNPPGIGALTWITDPSRAAWRGCRLWGTDISPAWQKMLSFSALRLRASRSASGSLVGSPPASSHWKNVQAKGADQSACRASPDVV